MFARTRSSVLPLLLFFAAVSVAPLSAQFRLALLPAVNIYDGAVGFDGMLHGDWEPAALGEVVPGLGLSALLGYSYTSASRVDTQGILAALGVSYRYGIGDSRWSASAGVYGGVQFTFFDGDDLATDSETPILLLPYLEAAYLFTDRIQVGIWAGFKVLMYDSDADESMERSVVLGPRATYRFGPLQ